MASLQRKSSRIILRPGGPKQEPDTDYIIHAAANGSLSSARSSPSASPVQTRPTSKKSSRDPASRKAEYNRLYYAKNRGILLKKAAERARTIRNPVNTTRSSTKKATIKIPASTTSTAPSTTRSLSSIASSDLGELSLASFEMEATPEKPDVEMPFWEESELIEALVPSTPQNNEIRQLLIDAHKQSMAAMMLDRQKMEKARNDHPLPAVFYKKR
ncbi:unnamed protein product [Rhizoctonia solani]|uniref:Uncharacterized protein n=3 Tax=Rhizoctonia solani TaxID=456999 RepID=A0A8H3A048_9AGAM|nr:hypothetical protein RSOL_445910 [Rhizoctonia solani AG-3 Rhs1AP]KEP50770.1 hypothetical protein V565_073900 [Rhizoctonia solani 123E]CAE6388279.1 unnamed protein product [Rhizoctonia solani]CAE6527030.1 unnamed protein product [Rhizoctonia solani]